MGLKIVHLGMMKGNVTHFLVVEVAFHLGKLKVVLYIQGVETYHTWEVDLLNTQVQVSVHFCGTIWKFSISCLIVTKRLTHLI